MQWLILDVPYVRLVPTPEYLLGKREASEAGGDDVTGNPWTGDDRANRIAWKPYENSRVKYEMQDTYVKGEVPDLTSWVILGVLVKRSRNKPRGRRSSRGFGGVDRRVSNDGTEYFWPLEAFCLVSFGHDGSRSGTMTMEDEMDWVDRQGTRS